MSGPRTDPSRRPQHIDSSADHARPAAAAADLHRSSPAPPSFKTTRRPHTHSHQLPSSSHNQLSPSTTTATAKLPSSRRKTANSNTMGQPPQPPQPDAQSLLDLIQSLEPVKGGAELQPRWMNVTIIEDDDLTFGGKPLSTWYEEDRRRYSFGENGAAADLGFDLAAEEEERRGRQRDRPHYSKPSHKHHHHHHHHKKASKAEEKSH